MRFLGYVYRFVSNFAFFAIVYFSLNFLDKYQQRAIVAVLVLVYAAMRAVTALGSFSFFRRIERLESEARRLGGLLETGPSAAAARKVMIKQVADLRRDGEMKAWIDLLFLGLTVVLCAAKIVTE